MASRPLCACGCGLPVRLKRNTWLKGHIPLETRVQNAKIGGDAFGYRVRRDTFAADLDRLTGRSLTRGELLKVFSQIHARGYDAGYHAAEKKWKRAPREAA
jgi:hypothetical protein